MSTCECGMEVQAPSRLRRPPPASSSIMRGYLSPEIHTLRAQATQHDFLAHGLKTGGAGGGCWCVPCLDKTRQ